MTLAELNKIKKNYKVIEIAVDFINPSYNISRAKHLDNARYIVCTLTENGIPRTVKTNEVARIRLQKPDRQPVYNDCDILEDGRVFITLTEQILAVEGNAVCDIQLTNEETGIIYSTKNFIINIDKTAVDNSVIESSYEFDALNNLITTNKKLNDKLEANEEIRQENESNRIDNENIRQENESNRVINENKRIEEENIRKTNETERINTENTRKSNEVTRQNQESDRQTNTATAITNAEAATKKANDAADDLQAKLDAHHFVLTEDKGSANGVAELDENGIIISSQLPSYVDDVIEGYFYNSKFYKESTHTTEITGESGKIYIDLSKEKTYRWSGSTFVVISETLALGESSSTAYRGDKGKIAYNHSQSAHAPSNAEENQNAFSKVNVIFGDNYDVISATSKTDALNLVAGDNITLTPNADTNRITISSTGTSSEHSHNSIQTSSGEYKLKIDGNVVIGTRIINNSETYGYVSLGTSDKPFNEIHSNAVQTTGKISSESSIYGKTIYENGTSLSIKYAAKSHASTATTYGTGTASNYGHVKLSDSYTSSGGAASAGVAASSKAVYDCYTALNSNLVVLKDTITSAAAGSGLTINATNYPSSKYMIIACCSMKVMVSNPYFSSISVGNSNYCNYNSETTIFIRPLGSGHINGDVFVLLYKYA